MLLRLVTSRAQPRAPIMAMEKAIPTTRKTWCGVHDIIVEGMQVRCNEGGLYLKCPICHSWELEQDVVRLVDVQSAMVQQVATLHEQIAKLQAQIATSPSTAGSTGGLRSLLAPVQQ